MAAALQYLKEHQLFEYDDLAAKTDAATEQFHTLAGDIQQTEAELSHVSNLMAAVVQYAKTRPAFDGYKAAKYSRKYLAEHEAELADYRAAKATMAELLGGEKLPKMDVAHFLSTKPGKKQYLPNKVRSEVSMDILLYFGGPALIAFLIQFLVGCRTQHKILRYIPIYCFVITLAFAIIALTSDSGFFLGGNVIAALVWCIIGVCFLIGYALAIFIYKHRK